MIRISRIASRAILIWAGWLGIGQTAYAQIDLPGHIQGRLTTADYQPVAFASILLRKGCYRTTTDANGQFLFRNLPLGDYVAHVVGPSIEPLRQNVMVVGGVSVQLLLVASPLQKSTPFPDLWPMVTTTPIRACMTLAISYPPISYALRN